MNYYLLNSRDNSIDFIKGCAIISVILLHSIPYDYLYNIYAQYYIWHAVPILLIISGVNMANYFAKKDNFSLSLFYDKNFLLKRVYKLMLPSLIVLLIQLSIIYFFSSEPLDSKYLKTFIIAGGSGPGSYFIYIALQNIIIVPFIFFLIKKFNHWGLLFLFFLNLIFDISCHIFSIKQEFYRISSIRYIFIIGLGVWVYLTPSFYKSILFPISIIFSFLSLLVIEKCYFNFGPLYPAWHTHTSVTAFWSLLIFYLLDLYYKKKKDNQNLIYGLLQLCGRFSLFIFLSQMVFFWLKRGIYSRFSLYSEFNLAVMIFEVLGCIIMGLFFGKIIKKVTNFSY